MSLTPSLSGLREIAQALSAAWDLDNTLALIARTTTHVMAVDSCSIYLLEREEDTLWLRASTGLSRKAVGRGALKLGEGLTGWAAQHNQPVAVTDAQADARFKFVPFTNERAFHSLLAVPLVNQGRVIGALNVQTVRPREFLPDQVELLALIGDSYGLARALEKLDQYSRRVPMVAAGGAATSHLFIVKPFSGAAMMNLFSTHPPVPERIRRLLGR